MTDPCPALARYLDGVDESLEMTLRMSLEWDEAAFRRLVQALVDSLAAVEGCTSVPRALAWMFVSTVPRILALTNRSDFLDRNPVLTAAGLRQRRELLRDLTLWFTDGRAAVPDERLRVDGWTPRSTPRSIPSGAGSARATDTACLSAASPTVGTMSLRVVSVTFDCSDPDGLAMRWAKVLGGEINALVPGEFVLLARPGTANLAFQRVPDPTPGKNRIHLDLGADDTEAEVARLVALGATVTARHSFGDDFHWVVLADPAGNAFCIAAE